MTATYLVSKKAQIHRILGDFRTGGELIFQCQPVRSCPPPSMDFENIPNSEIEQIHEDEVFFIDTNYWALRHAVDKALGIN